MSRYADHADHTVMFPEAVNAAWQRYCEVEACGERAAKIAALSVFVDLLEAEEPATCGEWAREFLARKLDRHEDLPLRTPLFRTVLFPFLEKEYADGDAAAARWLAGLAQDLFRCRPCWEALGHPSEIALWKEALRRNPNTESVRSHLVRSMANSIKYTLHEIPSGVLFGIDGATFEQCKTLLDELSEFRNLLSDDERETYRSIIEAADFHYREYGEYLSRGSREGYAKFLKSRQKPA